MTLKKEAILSTAKALFAESGYQAIGVDRITAASGASKMTLYSHFGNKENLIVEVLKVRDAEFMSSLRASVEMGQTGLERLKLIFDWHEAWFRREDFHGCMFIKASEEFAGQNEPIMSISRHHKTLILLLIEDCLQMAGAVDAEDLARLLFTLLEGMIVNAQMFGRDEGMGVGWEMIQTLVQSRIEEGPK